MLVNGDARQIPLKDESVQCVVTSPPYWGLRDYGVEGQLGLESTPEEYVTQMVAVFAEVWRVLKANGTIWVNLGDSYASTGRSDRKESPGVGATQQIRKPGRTLKWRAGGGHNFSWSIPSFGTEIKPKDLVGIPWRVAFALQEFGWYLRSDIIWAKSNPMPESVTDRPTKAHEYLFLLSKQRTYYYDADAIREPHSKSSLARGQRGWNPSTRNDTNKPPGESSRWRVQELKYSEKGRNKRTVWTIPTEPRPEAHFATFPQKLVKPCVLAGSKPGDVVFDPFVGSGTVVRVAESLNRKGVGLDLTYFDISAARTSRIQKSLLA